MKKLVCTIVALAIAHVMLTPAFAQLRTMNTSGAWETAANWSDSNVPDTAAESALLSGRTAGLSSTFTIDDLTVQSSSTLTITGSTLTVDALVQQFGGNLAGTGNLTANGASILRTSTMTGTGTTQYNGALDVQVLSGVTVNSGRTVITAGTTTFSSESQLNITSSTWNNTGTMTKAVASNTTNGDVLLINSTFNNSGTFINSGAGTFRFDTDGTGVFNNSGIVRVDAGTMTIENYSHSGSGQIQMNGGTLNITGNTNVSGGGISGNGTIDSNNVSLAAGTFVGPGNSAGSLTINGNLAMNADAEFRLELAGNGGVAGTDFDFLNVSGNVDVTGTNLAVSFINPFTPSVGQTFTFLTAGGTATGLFDSPTFDVAGYMGTVAESGGAYTLTITAVPEPGSLSLLAMGALGCTLIRRRRRR